MSRTKAHNGGQGRAATTRTQGQPKGQAKGGRPGTAQAARSPGDARPAAARPADGGRAAAEAASGQPRTGAAEHAAVVGGPPPWVQLTTLILSLAGLGVSIYLTITHYSTSVTLACPDTGTVNCEKVTTSPQSLVLGIPVAVLGLAFFVFMVAVNNPMAWRSPLRAVHLARVFSVIAGVGFVIYLIYVELFEVNAICLWCTSVHIITFALFVLILLSAAAWGLSERSR